VREIFPSGTISRAIRTTPLGILLVAAVLAMIGLGTIVAGFYLMIEEGSLTLWASIVALVIGPTILYLTYHMVRRTHWAWMALVCLGALMLISSLVRLFVSPSPVSPAGEIVIELLLLFYLTRPKMRASFGRVPAEEVTLTREA
jgi:hypothetical protein